MYTIIVILIIIVALIIVIYTIYRRESWPINPRESWPANPNVKNVKKNSSWTDKLIREELTEDDLKRHYNDMVRQAPIFSSGAGYSVVAEDNTSPAFTDYVGLFPPSYVQIDPGQRQITDLDVSQVLTRKRVKW